MKIYTKTGDDGTTGLFGGGRASKACNRVCAFGSVDETCSLLGQARAVGLPVDLDQLVEALQIDLFVLGAELASNPSTARPKGPGIDQVDPGRIVALEGAIDEIQRSIPALTSFILPGGAPAGALLHVARTVCRRAERETVALSQLEAVRPVVIIYLNRLSDLLFVLARATNHRAGVPEMAWIPRTAASSQR